MWRRAFAPCLWSAFELIRRCLYAFDLMARFEKACGRARHSARARRGRRAARPPFPAGPSPLPTLSPPLGASRRSARRADAA